MNHLYVYGQSKVKTLSKYLFVDDDEKEKE